MIKFISYKTLDDTTKEVVKTLYLTELSPYEKWFADSLPPAYALAFVMEGAVSTQLKESFQTTRTFLRTQWMMEFISDASAKKTDEGRLKLNLFGEGSFGTFSFLWSKLFKHLTTKEKISFLKIWGINLVVIFAPAVLWALSIQDNLNKQIKTHDSALIWFVLINLLFIGASIPWGVGLSNLIGKYLLAKHIPETEGFKSIFKAYCMLKISPLRNSKKTKENIIQEVEQSIELWDTSQNNFLEKLENTKEFTNKKDLKNVLTKMNQELGRKAYGTSTWGDSFTFKFHYREASVEDLKNELDHLDWQAFVSAGHAKQLKRQAEQSLSNQTESREEESTSNRNYKTL